ncbi:hypothetical protein [Streptomonospora sp. PA3]|uniref:hypothetical protein n=1 Tax=Streptomonospora sp. PA3 TaxID=2607326 RepID=UPI0012DD9306|nr:hypothetical protein [Streptomonospora sp. PA3]
MPAPPPPPDPPAPAEPEAPAIQEAAAPAPVPAPPQPPESPEPVPVRPRPTDEAEFVGAPLIESTQRDGPDGFEPLQIMVIAVLIAVAAGVGASSARR